VRVRRLLLPILLLPILSLPILLLARLQPARAGASPSLEGRSAPAWGPGSWVGTTASPQPADFAGRVVVVAVFPRGAAPSDALLVPLQARYRSAPDVALLAIAAAGARELAGRSGVFVCDGLPRDLEAAYGARRGAWDLVIDRRGVVRYQGPALAPARAARIVDALRAVGRQDNPLVGQPFGSLAGLRFHGARGHDFGAHRLTLVRWWTVSCPHCRASVPDLAALQRRHARDGLAFLPVYHFKGGRRWSPAELGAYLERLGHAGPFAEDPGWRKLRDVMQRAGFTRATSVSFLVDAEGVVRWAHAGPRVHASADPRHVGPDADLRGLEATVDALLAAPRRPAR
jgi:hypothetical protein